MFPILKDAVFYINGVAFEVRLSCIQGTKTILGILVKIPHYGNLQIDQIHVIWELPT